MALFLAFTMLAGLSACSKSTEIQEETSQVADAEQKTYIEETLNLANNEEQEWTYSSETNAWVLSIVSEVAYPELPDQQGVSVWVPGTYVSGIDTDGDGTEDVTADTYTDTVSGSLVIDYGQEDYVFGSSAQDARHWNNTLLEIFEQYSDVLESLFNQG